MKRLIILSMVSCLFISAFAASNLYAVERISISDFEASKACYTYVSPGVKVDGGGFVITPGGKPIPVDPWGPLKIRTEAINAIAR